MPAAETPNDVRKATDQRQSDLSDVGAGSMPVRYEDCTTRDRWRRCRCGVCKVCGFPKHMAIHGPTLRDPNEFCGHRFEPA